jgi:two-component system cell cycle sensor histidine kinase/response regulator CckA
VPNTVHIRNIRSSEPPSRRALPKRHWWRLPSSRIAIGYVIWSALWIVSSDYVLHDIVKIDPAKIWALETTKGLVYVLVTAISLLLFVRCREREYFAARRTSENRLRRVSESNLISICYWRPTGEITDANDAFLNLVGYQRKDLLEKKLNWRTLTPSEYSRSDSESLRRLILEGRHVNYEKEFLRKDKTRVPVLVGAAMLDATNARGVAYVLDMTELKEAQRRTAELESQLRQSQKLEAVGHLASGIAHDFNNLLNVIIGYTCLIDTRVQSNEIIHENAKHILQAAEKASGLIKKLLAFGRKQILSPELLDINATLKEYETLMPRLIGERVQLKFDLEPSLWQVEVDRNQLEQVIINLVVNARDAMPRGGSLTIHTSNHEDSQRVLMRICDTGIGMSEDTKAQIFDPFFTTKPEGQGTGLGLSTVYGIVAQSGGQISITSELGRGTTFDVFFPRANKAYASVPARGAFNPFKMDAYPSTANITILLAEDEPGLREIFSDLLLTRGYHILAAKNGEEAVTVARTFDGSIELFLTDIVMPKMNGIEAAQLIKNIRPNLPVVYMTGYAEDALSMPSTLGSDVLLEKPVAPGTLFDTIQNMLASRRKRNIA